MEPKRRSFGLDASVKTALAGLLVVLLLVATTLSVIHVLHQSIHLQGGANAHPCLMCSLAKGQVSTADVGLMTALLILCFLFYLRLSSTSSVVGFEYSPSQSRAPPRS